MGLMVLVNQLYQQLLWEIQIMRLLKAKFCLTVKISLNSKLTNVHVLGFFLAMQYPSEIPGITNAEFIRAAMNAGKEDDDKISVMDFITKLDEKWNFLA